MALGRSIAYNYGLPESMMQPQQAAQASAGRQANPFEGIEPPEGLQFVRGMTQGVYQKWQDINSYAKRMMAAGVDVTNPDFTDPYQVQAYQDYNDMVADVAYTVDLLKNSQNMWAEANKAGRKFVPGFDSTAQPFAQVAGTVEADDELSADTKEILDKYQRMDFNQPGLRDQAQSELDAHYKQKESDFTEAMGRGDKRAAYDAMQDMKAIRSAGYDPTENLKIAQRRAAAENKGDEADYGNFWSDYKNLRAGSTEMLTAYRDSNGNPIFKNAKINKSTGELIFDTEDNKGNLTQNRINLYTPEGAKQYAEIVDKFSGDTKFHWDTAWDLRPSDLTMYTKPGDIGPAPDAPKEFFQDQAKMASAVLEKAPEAISLMKNKADAGQLIIPEGLPARNKVSIGNLNKDNILKKRSLAGSIIKEVQYTPGLFGGNRDALDLKVDNGEGGYDTFVIPLSKERADMMELSWEAAQGWLLDLMRDNELTFSGKTIDEYMSEKSDTKAEETSEDAAGTNVDDVKFDYDGMNVTLDQLREDGLTDEEIQKAIEQGIIKPL